MRDYGPAERAGSVPGPVVGDRAETWLAETVAAGPTDVWTDVNVEAYSTGQAVLVLFFLLTVLQQILGLETQKYRNAKFCAAVQVLNGAFSEPVAVSMVTTWARILKEDETFVEEESARAAVSPLPTARAATALASSVSSGDSSDGSSPACSVSGRPNTTHTLQTQLPISSSVGSHGIKRMIAISLCFSCRNTRRGDATRRLWRKLIGC